MIGQIIGSLGGLAQSYIDAKTTVKITEAEIKKKQLIGEIDWGQAAIVRSAIHRKPAVGKKYQVTELSPP